MTLAFWLFVLAMAGIYVACGWRSTFSVYWYSLGGWRWHRKLRRETGEVYMDRFQLLRTKWLSVYINRINLPDADKLPHNHPWRRSYSLKLWGSYVEELWERAEDQWGTYFLVSERRPGRFNRIPEVHRIVQLDDGKPCWTLFVAFKVNPGGNKAWGFVKPDGTVIPSDERKRQRGVTSEV